MRNEDGTTSTYKSFKELMGEIAWSWDNIERPILKIDENHYQLNKLAVTPEHTEYKGEYTNMTPEIWQQFLKFVEMVGVDE